MKPTIGILNYKTGNISSICAAINLADGNPFVMNSPLDIERVDGIILPGIGHFSRAMSYLIDNNWIDTLADNITVRKKPVLGICLGMQLMGISSEEAPGFHGLSLLPITTKKIAPEDNITFKVPHVGWNSISFQNESSVLLSGIRSDSDLFYFSNSFAVHAKSDKNIFGSFYEHGSRYLATFESGNFFATQFHPEKSRKAGIKVLSNFVKTVG